jgi:hypothetical protein
VKRFVLGLMLAVSVCPAGVIVQSTFDTGDDGWRVGDLTGVPPLIAPAYLATGGNPGGFIQAQDVFWWTSFVAPASFLGDQSAAYGGELRFDQSELPNSGGPTPWVALVGGGLQLGYAGVIPGSQWTPMVVPLRPGGWIVGATLLPATDAQLLAVLSSLTALRINADYLDGADQVGLDNAMLLSAPEPGSLGLIACALGLLALRRTRRAV